MIVVNRDRDPVGATNSAFGILILSVVIHYLATSFTRSTATCLADSVRYSLCPST